MSPCTATALASSSHRVSKASKAVEGNVEFRVADRASHRVDGAHVLVVDPQGRVIASGKTDTSGTWMVRMNVPQDPRFASVKPMGTVTALVVAQGYNEQVLFEVPVSSHEVQPVILNPITKGQRNEPTIMLGNLHRHVVAELLNHYATQQGLTRQAPIPGELQYSPWGPAEKGGHQR